MPDWVPEEKIQEALRIARARFDPQNLKKWTQYMEKRSQKGFKKYDKPLPRRRSNGGGFGDGNDPMM